MITQKPLSLINLEKNSFQKNFKQKLRHQELEAIQKLPLPTPWLLPAEIKNDPTVHLCLIANRSVSDEVVSFTGGEASSWHYGQKLKKHLKHFFAKFQLSAIYRF